MRGCLVAAGLFSRVNIAVKVVVASCGGTVGRKAGDYDQGCVRRLCAGSDLLAVRLAVCVSKVCMLGHICNVDDVLGDARSTSHV